MTFTSYAQNFEDVMLWRALKHVDCGFYIDIGANDPVAESVTNAFYEKGWRGINIEPVSQWFERLVEERTRDINLKLAVGSKPGSVQFYEFPDTGLSTSDIKIAERHCAERGYEYIEQSVDVKSLGEICEEYHVAPIHFLKIDVEGAEKYVIEGIDFSKVLPWILVVESTRPNTQEEDYQAWEPKLLLAGYTYVYSDGLNRYYISPEHSELIDSFKYPPNFFDEFVLANQVNSDLRAQQLEAKAQLLEAKAQQLEAKVQQLEAKAQQLEAKAQQLEAKARQAEEKAQQAESALHNVYVSRSWRITAPLRELSFKTQHLRVGLNAWIKLKPGSRPRRLLTQCLLHIKAYVASKPKLRVLGVKLLHRRPGIHRLVRKLMAGGDSVPTSIPTNQITKFDNLPPKAKQIYLDLKHATEREKGKQ